jgi:hypothetical protein
MFYWRKILSTADQAGQSAVGLSTEPRLGLLTRYLLSLTFKLWSLLGVIPTGTTGLSSFYFLRLCLLLFLLVFFYCCLATPLWHSVAFYTDSTITGLYFLMFFLFQCQFRGLNSIRVSTQLIALLTSIYFVFESVQPEKKF